MGVAYYLYHNLSVVVPWKLSEVGEKRRMMVVVAAGAINLFCEIPMRIS